MGTIEGHHPTCTADSDRGGVDESLQQSAERLRAKGVQQYQILVDKAAPKIAARWGGWAGVLGLYLLRVHLLHGFYIITYALGIFNLNLLIGFISPQVDPELEGPALPTKSSEEFRPFVRRLPEMKFWLASTKSLLVGLACTLFPFLDIPVFWPILLFYWVLLFTMTMRKQIQRMVKYGYVPFSLGKKTYGGGGGGGGKKAVAK